MNSPEPIKKDGIPTEVLQADDHEYLHGKENWSMRMYFYLQNGLSLLNDFHNILLAMITLNLTFGIKNIFILIGLAVPIVIAFVFIGYYNVHKFSKMREWLNMRFGTHYGIKSFNFTQANYEALTEIRDLLRELKAEKDLKNK